MTLSVKEDYALHALYDLATQPPGEPVKIGEIARRQKIPQKFLELILGSLKQAGFVESRRGPEGGYLLARAPDDLTIGEVLRFTDRSRQRNHRQNQRSSPFGKVWQEVDEAVSAILDHTTFAQLVRAWEEQHARYVPNWEI